MPSTRRSPRNPLEITIADVAREAGVSVPTVSRILNDKPHVAAETRARVQAVIERLGFTPHAQAQRLRAGKTRNIALLFPLKHAGELTYNALETEFILGAAAASGDQNFFFNLHTLTVNEHNLLSLYRSNQVDGVVLMQINLHDWRVDLLRENGYPFVMIGHCADNTGLSFIDLDFKAGVEVAFDHVVEGGHRSIGFLALPADLRERGYGPAVRGWEGYQQSLERHHLAPHYREVRYAGQDMFDATLALLDETPDLTAIVTTHELAALRIVQALNQRGRRVPDDFSVVPLMTERIAQLCSPPMTHIQFPAYTMGYRAIDMLIRTINGELAKPEQALVIPPLIAGGSSAAVHST